MRVLRAIAKADKPVVLITSDAHRVRILHAMHEEKLIVPIRFLNKRDLFEKVFFSFKPAALYKASLHFKKKPAIIADWFGFLHKIDLDRHYASERLNTLKALKRYLNDNGLIEENRFGERQFKEKHVIVYGDHHDALFEDGLAALKAMTTVERIALPAAQETLAHVSVHDDVIDEIIDAGLEILRLHDRGVPLEKIKLLNVDRDYERLIHTHFNHLGLPVGPPRRPPLSNFAAARRFMAHLEKNTGDDFADALRDTFDHFKDKLTNDTFAQVYNRLLTLFNPTIRFITDKQAGLDYLEYLMDTATLPVSDITGPLEILTPDQVDPQAHEVLFIMNMHEGCAPVFQEENDFLSESEKIHIGFPTAKDINRLRKAAFTELPEKFARVYFSHANKKENKSINKAETLHLVETERHLRRRKPHTLIEQTRSRTLDMFHTKYLKDEFDTYGKVHPDLPRLFPMFKDRFNTYDNAFGGLDGETLERLIEKKAIPATRIESYFKCAFRFLLEHFIGITDDKHPFYRDLGTLFHDILEKEIDKETLDGAVLEQRLNAVLDKHESYDIRDAFFFKEALHHLETAHRIIKSQEKASHYAVAMRENKFETRLSLAAPFVLRGKIDKIMRDNEDTVIIDYKTGQPTLDLKTAYHGIHAQLLFYLLLYRSASVEARFTGFYEQTLIPAPLKRDDKKTKQAQLESHFRLQGYTREDQDKIVRFDPYYDEESMVRGLKVTKKGRLSKQSRTYAHDDLEILLSRIDGLLKDAAVKIGRGDFAINPKRLPNDKELSCRHCLFSDVCYKKTEDFVMLETFKDDQALFERLNKERE